MMFLFNYPIIHCCGISREIQSPFDDRMSAFAPLNLSAAGEPSTGVRFARVSARNANVINLFLALCVAPFSLLRLPFCSVSFSFCVWRTELSLYYCYFFANVCTFLLLSFVRRCSISIEFICCDVEVYLIRSNAKCT